MAIIVDHRKTIGSGSSEMNIYSMVLDRLLFLVDDSALVPSPNATKISSTTWEVMLWINQCFKMDAATIGIESNYTELQLSLMADVVAYYVLLYRAIALGAGVDGYDIATSTVTPNGLYLKKTKSDDTEVEWGQLSTTENSNHSGINIGSLMDSLYASMCSKISIYDCHICRCSDCSLSLEFADTGIIQPFVILGC